MQVALSRAALGGALGWEAGAAVAVEDGGFAARLAALVAQAQPEYAPLAEAAAARQEKLLRRKKEKPRKKR